MALSLRLVSTMCSAVSFGLLAFAAVSFILLVCIGSYHCCGGLFFSFAFGAGSFFVFSYLG